MKVDFSAALRALKAGERIARSGWNGKGMYVFLVHADDWMYAKKNQWIETIPKLPFIAMKTADNMMVPWLASQTDILAEDWKVVS